MMYQLFRCCKEHVQCHIKGASIASSLLRSLFLVCASLVAPESPFFTPEKEGSAMVSGSLLQVYCIQVHGVGAKRCC